MSIAIDLEPTIEQRLDTLAAKSGRTKADYLREAIARGLQDIEDIELADAAYERVQQGREPTYTSAEVRRELGLGD